MVLLLIFSWRFSLQAGTEITKAKVRFSCVGYETFDIRLDELDAGSIIKLTPANTLLTGVTIMPDSTLRSFLRRVYNKIPENYPDQPTRYKSFYREAIRDVQNDEHIAFMEYILDYYKTSYRNRTKGTVAVIDSRRFVSDRKFEDFPVSFYGGAHLMHSGDIVKGRSRFLEPHIDYDYQLTAILEYDNTKVYEISFLPADGSIASSMGRFYVDVYTLSYLRFEIESNDNYFLSRNRSMAFTFGGIKSTERTSVVNYENLDGTHFLKSIYDSEIFVNTDGVVFDSYIEFVMTEVDTDDVKNISFRSQVPIGYVPVIEATDYSLSGWKDYSLLELPGIANVVDTLSGNKLFTSKIERKVPLIERLLPVLIRIEFGVNASWFSFEGYRGNHEMTYQGMAFQSSDIDFRGISAFSYFYKYRMNTRNYLYWDSSITLNSKNHFSTYGLGIEHRVPIKTTGKQIMTYFNAGWFWHSYGRSLGKIQSDDSFRFGGKTIDAKKIEAYTGIRLNGLRLGGGLSFQLKSRVHFNLSANYHFVTNSRNIAIMKERSGFYFTRKTSFENLDNRDIRYTIDGEEGSSNHISFNNWSISSGLIFKF